MKSQYLSYFSSIFDALERVFLTVKVFIIASVKGASYEHSLRHVEQIAFTTDHDERQKGMGRTGHPIQEENVNKTPPCPPHFQRKMGRMSEGRVGLGRNFFVRTAYVGMKSKGAIR
jgi:hypothetical protein